MSPHSRILSSRSIATARYIAKDAIKDSFLGTSVVFEERKELGIATCDEYGRTIDSFQLMYQHIS
jgi:hypothetical protein